MRSSRLVSILMLLQARPRVTARELAGELEVSLRTVYRDVEALAAAGIPVYAEQGRAGGYRLVDGYRTRLTGLTEDEALSLFVVGMPGPAADLGLSAEAASAERKLLAALGPSQRVRAGRLRDRFSLDTSAWYHPAEQPAHLARWPRPCWRTASSTSPTAAGRRRARWSGDSRRTVSSSRTAPGTSRPETRDQCDGTVRTYRVSNILRLTTTGDRFERPAGFVLGDFWREHLDAFDRRRLSRTAVVRLSPGLVATLPDLSDAALRRAAEAVAPDDDGWTTVELPIEDDEMAARQLLPHADGVEVVSPESLRELLVAKAQAVLERYRPSLTAPGW